MSHRASSDDPAGPAAPRPHAGTAHPAGAAEGDAIRLLIVDDDEAVARTVAALAERAGASARWTRDADAFFATLDEWSPTHVAIDLVMPDTDGVEVLRELAARGCRAAVIISSGASGRLLQAAERSAREHGLAIAGVLGKPLAGAELAAALAHPGAPAAGEPVIPASRPAHLDEAALRAGIAAGHIDIALQPKVDVGTGALVGYEALARWEHPELGTLAPDRFIPLAERTEAIGPLTFAVVDRALTWLRQTHPAGEQTIAVNMSAACLGDLDLAERLVDSCRSAGLPPERVILEVTETGAMDDPVSVLDTLLRCRVKGFRLSIDDFGVGYSSLVALARLPFSELKVDRSFVMSASRSGEARSIIRAVIGLGRSLELRTVAEGVEDEQTLRFLREEGCEHAQGYHIARPMPRPVASRWAPAG